jgi:predicted MFS family arabinose efflux permease
MQLRSDTAEPVESQKAAGTPASEGIILFVLAAVQFTSIVDFMIVMPLGPQLMRSLAIGPSEFGLIVSSYTFAAGAAGLIASAIVDRFSRRTTFLALFSGFLLGTLFCALAPTYALLVAARVLTGAFGGILGGIALAIIGDVFPDERRGRATGTLMSAFALASVAGVPLGLFLGTKFGWHIPFLALVALGVPVLGLAYFALPPLNRHRTHSAQHPLQSLFSTFREKNHLSAFALIGALSIGGFAVIPYISPYLVSNVGMTESQLPLLYIVAGAVTLFAAPWIGKQADRFGKLRVYRLIAPISALLLVAITYLPPSSVVIGVAMVSCLMVSNAGRMIAAMAMITGSVRPQQRGGFMSANSSIQHICSGIGAYLGGLIIVQAADGTMHRFEWVGWIACITTLATLWLAGRLRSVDESASSRTETLAAAAEAMCDVGEPLIGASAASDSAS